jgi:hypothetical protein
MSLVKWVAKSGFPLSNWQATFFLMADFDRIGETRKPSSHIAKSG